MIDIILGVEQMTTECVAAIGLRALRGGAVVVAVSLQREPRVLLSSFLSTAAAGNRLSLEPYHVAYEMQRDANGAVSAEAKAAVAEGRRYQNELAMKGIEEILGNLADQGYETGGAALLVNRAGWVTDLHSYSLADPSHPAVAEGLAVREAIRSALHKVDVRVVELDEKSLLAVASRKLELPEKEIGNTLKSVGLGSKPWRKEQKNACLAAWILLATQD